MKPIELIENAIIINLTILECKFSNFNNSKVRYGNNKSNHIGM